MRERVNNIRLRIVLDIFLYVFLGDVDIFFSIGFLVLFLEVTIILLGRDEPNGDEIVEDNHNQEI